MVLPQEPLPIEREQRLDRSNADYFGNVVRGLVLAIFGLFATFFLYRIAKAASLGFFVDIATEHSLAIVGMPSCAIAALCLVLLLRTTSGEIEFEGLGFKFKGASGPIVMWVLCFLVMGLVLKAVW
jgi:hypothetical protein